MVRPEPTHVRFSVACLLGLTITSLTACGGGEGGGDVGPPPTPASIAVMSGNGQSGEAGSPLAQPIIVRVTSSSGAAVEAAAVTFAAGSTSGSVAAGQATTDADGRASTAWTVGTEVGANSDTVYASVSGVATRAVFTASITAAPAAGVSSVSGDAQGGTPGQVLTQPLIVVVRDRYGNPRSHSSVSWTVVAGGGSISPATGITGTDGHTSALWTLGSAGINTVHAVSADLPGSPVSFSATVTSPGSRLAIVSGNNQTGAPSQPVPLPLVVSVKTPSGAPVAGIGVSWAISTGGGAVSHSSTPTDAQGLASVIWTLGAALGQQSVTAGVTGASGSPLTFNATAANPSGVITLTSITPNPMIEGQPATLIGTGFSTTPAGNTVRIDQLDATVTAATATSLTIQVPAFDCQPARQAVVQVRIGAESSNAVGQNLHPAAFTSVAVGQQLLLQNPQQFCLQFASATLPEDYLIGVQSTSEVVSSLTPARLEGSVAPGSPIGVQMPEVSPRARRGQSRKIDKSTVDAAERRAAAEARLRRNQVEYIYPLLSRLSELRWRSGVRSTGAIPAELQPGDVISIRYPGSGNSCTSFTEIQTLVRSVGQYGVWLEDLENPVGGFTTEDIQQMSREFDARIYTTVTSFFGLPTDLDGNGRIGVVLTKRVNEMSGVAGFVTPSDLIPRFACPGSNDGEIYYGFVPDPSGVAGDPMSRDAVMAIAVPTIAHEFTHIIQLGNRVIVNGLEPHSVWIMEGQARLAEEITGHAFEGRVGGQNYGYNIAFNLDNPTSFSWYSSGFIGLFQYYGFRDPESKVPTAPEECTWLSRKPDNPSPCIGNQDVYAAPWSLLRWISDHFGANYADGERGLHQALIRSRSTGFAALAEVTGVPIRTLLAQWAATLYVDDRISGAANALQLPSWNLFDIESNVFQSASLIPRSREFRSFSDEFNVRAGSSAYFRVSGVSRPGTAVRISSQSGQTLPSNMQVFVVRLQ